MWTLQFLKGSSNVGWDNSTNFGDNSRSCGQIPNFYEAWDVQLAANDVILVLI